MQQEQASSVPSGWRRQLWLALLVASSIAFSLGFACAVPFAAFGTVLALTMPRRDALLLIVAVWFANQLVGYGILDYPRTAESVTWGAALGIVAVLAMLVARAARRRFRGLVTAPLAAFLASFAAYEAMLFIVAAALLGGVEDFAPMIIGRIFAINAVALLGLLALNRFGTIAGLAAPLRLPLAVMERHA
ncbi:MAG: hypothetical protein JO010_00995 [Alphaproteobacteria bacterium]|nr:hypothetical protein [Alphaproteobacteria bacterium]